MRSWCASPAPSCRRLQRLAGKSLLYSPVPADSCCCLVLALETATPVLPNIPVRLGPHRLLSGFTGCTGCHSAVACALLLCLTSQCAAMLLPAPARMALILGLLELCARATDTWDLVLHWTSCGHFIAVCSLHAWAGPTEMVKRHSFSLVESSNLHRGVVAVS